MYLSNMDSQTKFVVGSALADFTIGVAVWVYGYLPKAPDLNALIVLLCPPCLAVISLNSASQLEAIVVWFPNFCRKRRLLRSDRACAWRRDEKQVKIEVTQYQDREADDNVKEP